MSSTLYTKHERNYQVVQNAKSNEGNYLLKVSTEANGTVDLTQWNNNPASVPLRQFRCVSHENKLWSFDQNITQPINVFEKSGVAKEDAGSIIIYARIIDAIGKEYLGFFDLMIGGVLIGRMQNFTIENCGNILQDIEISNLYINAGCNLQLNVFITKR